MDGITQPFEINPIKKLVGAEIVGLDLKQPIGTESKKRLNQALLDHVAVVIRGGDLSAPEFVEAMKAFGEPMEQQYSQFQHQSHPLVQIVSNQHKTKEGKEVKNGASWHSDHTNHETPPKCTVLHAITLPKEGGDTGVLNTRAAFASLPEDIKRKIKDLKTVNVFHGRAALRQSTKQPSKDDIMKWGAPVIQPLVRTHPETGEKAIYFHTVKIDYIEGMSPEETRDLLRDILERIDKPEFVYRHKWQQGDVLIWDNRCALHQAYYDYDTSQPRALMRIILKGDKPY